MTTGRRRIRLVRLLVVWLVPTVLCVVAWYAAQQHKGVEGTPPEALFVSRNASSFASVPPEQGTGARATRESQVTPLLSLRRTPGVISNRINDEREQERLAPYRRRLLARLGASSCALLVDADGHELFRYRSNESVVPASNTKLFTASVALAELDQATTMDTIVYGAPPLDGVIVGPLRIVGGGDPLLSTRSHADANGLASLQVATVDALAEQLAAAGVRQVDGDIIGDASRYDGRTWNSEWSFRITPYDVGPLSALIVNSGLDDESSVPEDAAATAAQHFKSALAEVGISVTGEARSLGTDDGPGYGAGAPPGTTPLAVASSPPLSTIIEFMLLTSDNLVAELLLKEVGLQAEGEGSTASGLEELDDWGEAQGVPTEGFDLVDGSGLSSNNRVSCRSVTELLRTRDVGPALVEDLPVAGQTGTLADYFLDSSANGALRAKTGTLIDVKALSGTAPDASGEPVVFSLIINGPEANSRADFELVWYELVELIGASGADAGVDREMFEPKEVENGKRVADGT